MSEAPPPPPPKKKKKNPPINQDFNYKTTNLLVYLYYCIIET